MLAAWLAPWLAVTFTAATALAADNPASDSRTPGVEYRHLTEDGPQSIHGVSFDLARTDLALAAAAGPGVQGKETVPELVAHLPPAQGRPVAAINGDYFEYKGEPRYFGTLQGVCVAQGELLTTGSGAAFWVDAQDHPHMGRVDVRLAVTWPNGSDTAVGLNCSTRDFKSEVRADNLVLFTPAFGPSTRSAAGAPEWILEPAETNAPWLPLRPNADYTARVREVRTAGDTPIPQDRMVLSLALAAPAPVPTAKIGDTLTFRAACSPDLSNAPTVISGGPLLLAHGQFLTKPTSTNRAPRTAVGLAGSRVWFVAVDGRRPDLAAGMSHHELADLMRRLGCTDALNLDGGGSTTLWYQGKIINSPSDGAPRPVGNALILLKRQDEHPEKD